MVAESSARPLAAAILNDDPYPVRSLIIQGANTLLTWPDTKLIRKAFEKLDFLVVCDLFMTETAEMADVFIPAATALEQDMVWDYSLEGIPLVALGNRVIRPLGESQPDWRFWAMLGQRLGYSEYFPWKNDAELITDLLSPSGISLQQLRANPGGLLYRSLEHHRGYQVNGFQTPSGLVELSSERLHEHGFSMLPTYLGTELAHSPEYPYTLTTGARTLSLVHSQHRNVETLRNKVEGATVLVNPADAKKAGIVNADMVTIVSPRGSVRMRAEVSGDVRPGVITAGHGWQEANVNELIDDRDNDPISGFPAFKRVACQLRT
jgi:anaerobic selenocysteine-containing dehydrogenase